MIRRPRRSDWMVGLVFMGVAILVAGVGMVAYRSLGTLFRAYEGEVHTQVVLVAVERENSLIREAESARRGFTLTNDEDRAEEFKRAAEGARRTLKELRQLTSDDPSQQRRLADLAPLLDRRLGLIAESIERHRQDPTRTDVQVAATREGVALNEPIHRLLDEMVYEQKELLHDSRAKAAQGTAESGRVVLFSTVLAVLALAGAGVLLFRSSAARHKAEARLASERALLVSVVEGMGDGLVSADAAGRLVLFNPAAERLLGAGKTTVSPELRARDYGFLRADAVTPFPVEELPLTRALRGERSDGIEMYVSRADGGVWIDVAARPLRDAAGAVTGAFVVFSDITERRRAAAEIEAVNARLERTVADLSRLTEEKTMLADLADMLHSCLTFEEAYGAVAYAAAHLFSGDTGELFVVNPSQNYMLRAAAWGERPASGVDMMFEPEDCWAARRGSVHLALGTEGGLCAHIPRPTSGRHVCVPLMGTEGTIGVLHLAHGSPSERGGEAASTQDERVRTVIAAANLIASALTSLRLQDKLRIQSIRDPLTGLFNRRYMEESLTREIRRAKRSGGSVGVIMLDIDHFKRSNDEHGHAAGDSVLRELGALLASLIRDSDIACRYGGEEFTLILPDANLEETSMRAETIRVAVAALQTRLPNGAVVTTTISQGIAAFPQHGATPAELLLAADGALYQAKRGGRNRVERAPVVAL